MQCAGGQIDSDGHAGLPGRHARVFCACRRVPYFLLLVASPALLGNRHVAPSFICIQL